MRFFSPLLNWTKPTLRRPIKIKCRVRLSSVTSSSPSPDLFLYLFVLSQKRNPNPPFFCSSSSQRLFLSPRWALKCLLQLPQQQFPLTLLVCYLLHAKSSPAVGVSSIFDEEDYPFTDEFR